MLMMIGISVVLWRDAAGGYSDASDDREWRAERNRIRGNDAAFRGQAQPAGVTRAWFSSPDGSLGPNVCVNAVARASIVTRSVRMTNDGGEAATTGQFLLTRSRFLVGDGARRRAYATGVLHG